MAQMGQMHANLMRAPRFQSAFDEAGEGPLGIAKAFHHAITRARVLAGAAKHRHALTVERIAADLAFDQPFAEAWAAPHDGMIGALDGMAGELLAQAAHRALVLGGDEQAAGVL